MSVYFCGTVLLCTCSVGSARCSGCVVYGPGAMVATIIYYYYFFLLLYCIIIIYVSLESICFISVLLFVSFPEPCPA